jgi:hypothetical protein
MDLHRSDEGHGQIAFNGFYELALTRAASPNSPAKGDCSPMSG